MARVVGDLQKRRVKGETWRGGGVTLGEGEVKSDIRCQTEGGCQCEFGSGSLRWGATHVDMMGDWSSCVSTTHSTADYRLVGRVRGSAPRGDKVEAGSDGVSVNKKGDGEGKRGGLRYRPSLSKQTSPVVGGTKEKMSEDGQTRTTRGGGRGHTYPRRQITARSIGYRWPPRRGPMMHNSTRGGSTGGRGILETGPWHAREQERSAECGTAIRARDRGAQRCKSSADGGPGGCVSKGLGSHRAYQNCSWAFALKTADCQFEQVHNLKHGDELEFCGMEGRVLRPTETPALSDTGWAVAVECCGGTTQRTGTYLAACARRLWAGMSNDSAPWPARTFRPASDGVRGSRFPPDDDGPCLSRNVDYRL